MPTDPVVTSESAAPAEAPVDDSEEVVFDSTRPEPELNAPVEVNASPEATTEAPAGDPTPEPVVEPAAGAPVEPLSTPAPDVDPPAPPVEEGKAWNAEHNAEPALLEPATPVAPQSPLPQAELEGAQGDMNTILAGHSDLTTDAPNEEETGLAPKSELPAVADPAPEKTTETTNPERQAAVARLQGHIDELETSLQKVRDELDALKV